MTYAKSAFGYDIDPIEYVLYGRGTSFTGQITGDFAGFSATAPELVGTESTRLNVEGLNPVLGPSDVLQFDRGTRLGDVICVEDEPSAVPRRFRLTTIGNLTPRSRSTRMARIRELARLPLRRWAEVFGVSHSAIQAWERREPAREELDTVLVLLQEAATRHADLKAWLTSPLAGTEVTTPFDLLATHRWRAFRGAVRLRRKEGSITSQELVRRRRESVDWALADAPVVVDSE